MKKAFIGTLFFYISFHFIVPEIYYFIFGDIHIYSDFFDSHSANVAFLINLISILLAILIINQLPLNDIKIKPRNSTNAACELYYFSIIFGVLYLYVSGGFEGVINGVMLGGFMNYINIFFNPVILLMCAIFLQGGKKLPVKFMIFIFLIVSTAGGSRGAIITVIFICIYGLSYTTFDTYKSDVFKLLKYLALVSPVLFYFATKLRDSNLEFELQSMANLIIGRISAIELGMIPIYHIDNGGADLTLFYEKYGLLNQLKLIIDATIPGQIFDFDVMPNNYFRAIFLGFSTQYVMDYYMSMNITLPVYFYAYFGYGGIIAVVILLIGYFGLLSALRNYPYVVLVLLYSLYPILVYFDWVMVFTQFYSGLLTIVTLKIYIWLKKSIIDILLKNRLSQFLES